MRTQSGNYLSDSAARLEVRNSVRWYVVANRLEAVFYQDTRDTKFQFVDRLKNPRGNSLEGELDSARPGSGTSSAGNGTIRHGLDRTFHHHERVAKKFAEVIARSLAKKAQEGQFNELVLAAEPHFLGLLRASLSPQVRHLIKSEVNREYAQGSDLELYQNILRAIEAS
jgi:protein required for attachment to host cells